MSGFGCFSYDKFTTDLLLWLNPNLSNRRSAPLRSIWVFGREPWSSGYGRRHTFQRLWVRIPAPDTDRLDIFSHWFVVKNVLFVYKRPKINEKEAGNGPFKKKYLSIFWSLLLRTEEEKSCISNSFIIYYLGSQVIQNGVLGWMGG